ncbi:GMC oxidoreductase [Parahaliea maris]|uniref:GMC oxidoreductase n=1 Tax=Parahaliea maris TaxID=2716870 RepID=A0A5C9A5E6_9GAMM|nr:GMC family oxidoreductase N-terminal domain-containing protein [Parahaliea maris]TXS96113.1 GMC oxidoreductase [Parahaliea maris]
MPTLRQSYDYIIVGAGSAGCALANRLSRESSRSVLLVEAGPKGRHPLLRIPLGFAFLMNHKTLNWGYHTEPEQNLSGRRISWPRGRVLGGTSAINGMVYIRGQADDYDSWANLGCHGWDYQSVLPYFLRSEHYAGSPSSFHGRGGPLWVEEFEPAERWRLADIFVQAAMESGLPFNNDFNGADQEGVGYYQKNIRRGRRHSARNAYLDPVSSRPNLTVVTGMLARRLLLDANRVSGVELQSDSPRSAGPLVINANREVILCGGAINSPQLLELSGIGNGELLSSLGIDVIRDAPGVGENLQDHLTVNVLQGLSGVKTFHEETRPLRLLGNLAKYAMNGSGLLSHPAAQVGAFFRTSEQVKRPDAQVHFAPAASETDSRGNMKTRTGTTATVCFLRPASRGSIHIASPDPTRAPLIRANYLSEPEDVQSTVAAVRRVRQIFQAPTFAPYRQSEILPGPTVNSDEQLLRFIQDHAESVYHPVGTCRMGADQDSVVDERLRVRGIEALRIADASIMPILISGNTHAPTTMIAEKCADLILEDSGVPLEPLAASYRRQLEGIQQ